ncbi:hypothetical protein MFRU_005g01580 [Monilinia fructicola]|uniref:Uncharacterized protein n=1 Tax=Monilinia fructicola TaxID=38448 RepID=A0A5M9JSU9_MONFR|nr:hypothetical protein EYC84_002333 [Monilinia fructicola]KAG4033141.1 hypothetical protein MFRU_005g01580 [Monilinia fructicola]
MGQESLIIAVIIIVVTVIGGAVAFSLWHKLRRSRRHGEAVEMRNIRERRTEDYPIREHDPDGRRVRERAPNSRAQDRDPDGGPSIAEIVCDTPGHSAGGTERNEQEAGRSLADIVNPPPRHPGKSATDLSKRGKERDKSGASQETPSTSATESSVPDPVPKSPAHAEIPANSLLAKSKGKRAPGKIRKAVPNPEDSDTLLIRVESSPSRSQDDNSVRSES